MQREFEQYLKCGRLEYGFLRVMASIEDPELIRLILEHLEARKPAEAPAPLARAPPLISPS